MGRRLEFTKDNKVIGGITFLNSGNYAELNIYGQILDEDEPKESDGDTTNTEVVELLKNIGNKDLVVHINSGGGSVFAGIGIYNAIRHMCKGKIIVKIMGIAGSIASVIAMAGDVIIMPVNTQMMIHKPSVAAEGNADDLMNLAKVLDNIQKVILNTYMTRTRKNITRAYINKLMNETSWLSPFECKKIFKNIKIEENGGFDNMTNVRFSGYIDDYEDSIRKRKHDDWDDDDRRKSHHKDEEDDYYEDSHRRKKSHHKDEDDEDFEDYEDSCRRKKSRHKDEDDDYYEDSHRKKKSHHKDEDDDYYEDSRKRRKAYHKDEDDEDFEDAHKRRRTHHKDDEDDSFDDYEREEYRKHKRKEKAKKKRVKNMIDDFDDEIAQFLGMEE